MGHKQITVEQAVEAQDRIRMIKNLAGADKGLVEHLIQAELKTTGFATENDLELFTIPSELLESVKEDSGWDDVNADDVPWDLDDLMEPVAEVIPEQPKEATMKEKQAFQVPQHKKGKHTNKHGYEKDRFVPVVGGIQLQPMTEMVPGTYVVPQFNGEKGVVTSIKRFVGEIEVSTPSSFRELPITEYVTFASQDAGVKAQMLWQYLRAVNKADREAGLPEEEWRIPVGNIKKEDCILGVMTKAKWDEFFGCDVRMLNLWKVILPAMTPTAVKILHKYSNIKTIRLRVLDALRTEAGFPEHDGDAVIKVRHEFYRHADLEKDKDGKIIIGEDGNATPKGDAKVKKVDRNWQLRVDGFDLNGNRLPEIKAKPFSDYKAYAKMCVRFGFDEEAQDGFITKDNLKTLKHLYKNGDILEFDIKYLRNIKSKLKEWASSIGAQCIASSDHLYTREILNGHGILERADIIKWAAPLRLAEVFKVFSADKEASWDDSITFPVKCAFSRYVGDSWYLPRMFKDTFYPRLESFYKDYGIKVSVGDDGFYLQGDDELDALENINEEQTGTLQFYVMLPDTAKFKGKMSIGDRINIGRDPWAGPSNMMTFVVAGFVKGLDYMLLSWQALFAMYADVDGDTQKFETLLANTSDRSYPCMRRQPPAVKVDKGVPAELMSMRQYMQEHEDVGMSVLKAAADTGSLDLTTRQLIEERLYAGIPFSNDELMELSEFRQAAIDGMKHIDQGAEDDAKQKIIKMYGVNGKMAKLKDAPMTYLLLRKDAGKGYLNEIARFEERIRLVGMCNPHADHPYRDYVMALKGIKAPTKGADVMDSEWLFNVFYDLWKQVVVRHAEGQYSWLLSDVEEFGKWMAAHHKSESIDYMKLDDETKKAKFTALKDSHRALIYDRCIGLFNSDKSAEAEKYQVQLAIYLGMKGFGKGLKTEYDEHLNEKKTVYGRGGGAMWHVLEEHVLSVAEIINIQAVKRGEFPENNPFLKDIREALVRNRIKAAEKAANDAQRKADDAAAANE